MARLAAFLFGSFNAFLALIASWLGKKAAVSAALIAVYLAAVGALWSSVKLLLGGLTYVFPQSSLVHWLMVGFNLVLPPNWELCLAAIVSSDVAVFLYRFNQNRIVGAAAQA